MVTVSTSRSKARTLVALSMGAVFVAGCTSGAADSGDSGQVPAAPIPTIVVSNAVLGAVTSEVAGSSARVLVLIPNGVDPHLYEPSAKDIERLNSADLVVINGWGYESRLEDSVRSVRDRNIPIFQATDHVLGHEAAARTSPEGAESADESAGHRHRDEDPHFWTDPRLMSGVVEDLGIAISDLGIDIGDRAMMFSERLLTFDQEMQSFVERLPVERRVLVTGHESLGYFAERYGFDVVGTFVPGLTSAAEVSAQNLADVRSDIERAGVGVIFVERDGNADSARVLSKELGVDVVEISTHVIGDRAASLGMAGDTYIEFIRSLTETIVSALFD